MMKPLNSTFRQLKCTIQYSYLSLFSILFFCQSSMSVSAQNMDSIFTSRIQEAGKLHYDGEFNASNKILEVTLGLFKDAEDQRNTAIIYRYMGGNYSLLYELAKAMEYQEKALEIFKQLDGEKSENVALTYERIGSIYELMGLPSKSLDLWKKTQEIYLSSLGELHPRNCEINNKLGVAYLDLGNYDKAWDHLQKALNIGLAIYDESHVRIGAFYTQLGICKTKKNDYESAISYLKDALKIALQHNQPAKIAGAYSNLSNLYAENREVKLSIKYSKQAIDILLNMKEPPPYDLAVNYQHLASTYLLINNYEEGMVYAKKALSITLKIVGEKHSLTSQTYTVMNQIYVKQGKWKAALKYAQKALTSASVDFNDSNILNNPKIGDISGSIYHLFLLGEKINTLTKKWEADKTNFSDLELAYKTWQSGRELWITEKKQLSAREESLIALYTNSYDFYFYGLNLASNLYEATHENKYLEFAHENSEYIHSHLLLSAFLNMNAFEKVGLSNDLWKKEQSLKKEIFKFEIKTRAATVLNDSTDLALLNGNLLFEAKQDLEDFKQQLAVQHPKYYNIKYGNNLESAKTIQHLLDENTLFIQYAFGYDNDYIFTIDKTEGIGIHKLVFNKDVYNKIPELTTLLQSYNLSRADKRASFISISHQLYTQCIDPIKDKLKGKKKIIIIGDKKLTEFPFEILLPSNENKSFHELDFLVKDYEISYHYSGTLFAQSQNKKQELKGDLLAFAPVFSEGSSSANLLKAQQNTIDTTLRSVDINRFEPLLFSEAEVKGIRDLFIKEGKNNINLLLHEEASEESLKEALEKQYEYIHIASHSFANLKEPKYSGIACIQPQEEGTPEDGILHTGEIYNLAVNSKLVVLSSCESGKGQLIATEGMLGLNRSFVYAGVPNVMYSLWKVYDQTTNDMMQNFYANVLKGKSYSTALRAAKIKMLEVEATASPHYWSTFLLIGR